MQNNLHFLWFCLSTWVISSWYRNIIADEVSQKLGMKILQLSKIHFLLLSMANANKKNLQTKTLLHQKTGLHQSFKAMQHFGTFGLASKQITTFSGSHLWNYYSSRRKQYFEVFRHVHSETMRHSDTDHMTLSWFQPIWNIFVNLNLNPKNRLNILAMLETNISNTWLIPIARKISGVWHWNSFNCNANDFLRRSCWWTNPALYSRLRPIYRIF